MVSKVQWLYRFSALKFREDGPIFDSYFSIALKSFPYVDLLDVFGVETYRCWNTILERIRTERLVEGMMISGLRLGGLKCSLLPSEKKAPPRLDSAFLSWVWSCLVTCVAKLRCSQDGFKTLDTSISYNFDKVSKTLDKDVKRCEQCHHNPGFARRWMPVILESYSGLLIIWPLIWIAKTPCSAVGLVISEQFWEARNNLVGNCLVGTIAWNFLYLIGTLKISEWRDTAARFDIPKKTLLVYNL